SQVITGRSQLRNSRPSTSLTERTFDPCSSAPTLSTGQNQDTARETVEAFERSVQMSWAGHELWSVRPVCPSWDCRASFSLSADVVAPTLVRASVRAWPIDAPALVRQRSPDQFFGRIAPSVVIQRGSALVEAASVPGVAESELQEIQMV